MAKGWKLSFTTRLRRFRANIQIPDDDSCWIWTGFRNPAGYGRYKWNGKNWLAHRLFYKLFIDENFDDNLKICHTCDNPRCVRPSHLFVGTQQENIEDMHRKGRGRPFGRPRKNQHKSVEANNNQTKEQTQ